GRTGGGVFNTVGKSGSNVPHGSALVQNRPQWGAGKLFFSKDQPKPDSYFWLYGGSFGAPIVRNRTFFWAATENYQTLTSRSAVLFLPTERELRGDFSQTLDAAGRLVVIYDPLTTRADPTTPGQFIRDPSPGNVIPANRMNVVARNIAANFPRPSAGNLLPATAQLVDRAHQATLKVDQ